MTQKDYILRIAEDVGRALAQVIYHKEIHDYQGSLSLIDELFKQAVGAGSGFIHAISEETDYTRQQWQRIWLQVVRQIQQQEIVVT